MKLPMHIKKITAIETQSESQLIGSLSVGIIRTSYSGLRREMAKKKN